MQATPKENTGPVYDLNERPNAPNPASRLALSNELRRSIADTARIEGNSNQLWQSASSLASIHLQFAHPGKPASVLEIDLHDLWFTYYHAAKNAVADNPMLDRLIVQILQARELGPLYQTSLADTSIKTMARTSDGLIWADLPFLVLDMTEFWLRDWPAMSPSNLLGFSTFLAKLASIGICNDRMSSVGLILLRDALETPRPLGRFGEEHSEDQARLPQDVTIAELLPVVNSWLFHAGYKIIQLADARWSNDADSLGELFRIDPLCSPTTLGGFSPERWIFWLKRLEQVAEEAERAGDARLGETIRRYMDNMLFILDERDSAVKRMLQDSPGVIRHQPIIQEFGRN